MADTAVIHYILEEVNVDYKMLDLKSSFFNSAGSRPWDKGGLSHPDPLIGGGGAVSKKFFFALQASVWSKNKEGPGPGPSPISVTVKPVCPIK